MVNASESAGRAGASTRKRARGPAARAHRAGWRLPIPALAALLTIAAGYAAAAAAVDVSARLERNPIRADETVRLIIEKEGVRGAERPDLRPLARDFEHLGTSTNTQIRIHNGTPSATARWIIELAPRRSGDLEIPALALGAFSTPPLVLRVEEAKAAGAGAGEELFIETEVFPAAPYVQSQITYTLRLFRAVEILDGSLEEPRAENALVERLGRDAGYTATRGGRSYRVIERRYAIFPQSSGELHIPPVRFDAEVEDTGTGASSFSRMFMPGRRVRLRTEEYRLEVRPRPPEFEGQTWLPARSLHLVEQWSEDPPALRVGEPLTRTLAIHAAGLRGDQLPEIEMGSPDGLRVYPDQPVIRTASDAELVYGSREQRFAVVPLRDGEVTLPEIRVRWWDGVADSPAEALIPARTFVAAPAPVEAADLVSALSSPERSGEAGSAPFPAEGAAAGIWRWVSAALLALWAATAFAWWRARRGASGRAAPADPRAPRIAKARRALHAACAGGRAEEARDALLDWAAAARPDAPPRSLGEAARRFDPALAARVRDLDRHLYATGEEAWNAKALWKEAKTALRRRAARPARRKPPPGLPPLYPERTGSDAQRRAG